MYSDSHTHTAFSGDCATPVREHIEAAIALGMKELSITDHHDYDVDSGDTDFRLDVESYLPAMAEFKELYRNKIRLNIGIEFGHQPHLSAYEKDYFSRYAFDIVIGSTHFVDGLDPYYPESFAGRDETEVYRRYFAVLCENLNLFDNYDIAAHLDYIVRYGPNKNRNFQYRTYADHLDEILNTLIQKGKGLECNTGGLRKGLGEPNPSREILTRYRELGGEILTLGSDAHRSHELGYDFDRIGEILKHCGYRYYCTYQNRKPVFHKL